VKFSSIVSIQIFSLKNANPSINEIHVENDYFPLPSKFEMKALGRIMFSSTWMFVETLRNYVTKLKHGVFGCGSMLLCQCLEELTLMPRPRPFRIISSPTLP
jgi:hypothetical protein